MLSGSLDKLTLHLIHWALGVIVIILNVSPERMSQAKIQEHFMHEIVHRGMEQSTFDNKSTSGNGIVRQQAVTWAYVTIWRHLAAGS